MITRTWKDPNFEFEASDVDGQTHRHITFANSEAELRQRLEAIGLTVQSITNYDFSEWQERAAEATKRAIDAHIRGEAIEFQSSLWRELKWHLFELFHGKCAYCEGKALIVAAGDVGHYRPKGSVEEDPTHPGYYWLAYEVSNLLPCCERCNRARGKANQFPVEPGTRAYRPEELANEGPLLLNPYDAEDPRKHLEFTKFGTVIERTERGKESIRVYHLNRPGLAESRLQAQSGIVHEVLIATFADRDLAAAFDELHTELRQGEREYSAALLAHLDRWTQETLEGLQGLQGDMAEMS